MKPLTRLALAFDGRLLRREPPEHFLLLLLDLGETPAHHLARVPLPHAQIDAPSECQREPPLGAVIRKHAPALRAEFR